MNIGVINESSKIENRAGLSPSGVSFLVERGHTVYVQAGAGLKSGYSNEEYTSLGAKIVFTKEEAFGRSDIVLNISPLDEEECLFVKTDQILFGFHHLAVSRKCNLEELLKKNVTMIGYEVVQQENEELPFIESLSEIAGQMCLVISGHYLQTSQGGRGLVIGGVVSVPPATAVVVGSGVLARSAIKALLGAGAHTIALGRHMDRLRELEETSFLQHCDIVKASLQEVKALTGCSKLLASVDKIREQGVQMILVTMGNRGALAWFGEELYHIPACKPKAVKDPTGAGDAFAGGFLAKYTRGREPGWCCCVGSAASSFVVEKVGSRRFGEKAEVYERATEIYEKGVKPLSQDAFA